jgi:hypothetical protein
VYMSICTKCKKFQGGNPGWTNADVQRIQQILGLQVTNVRFSIINILNHIVSLLGRIPCVSGYKFERELKFYIHSVDFTVLDINNQRHVIVNINNLATGIPRVPMELIDRCELRGRRLETRLGDVKHPSYEITIFEDPRKEFTKKHLEKDYGVTKVLGNVIAEYT